MAFNYSAINPAFGRGSQPLLGSSVSSITSRSGSHHGRHHGHASNSMSKIYRQASTLFLTRRLPEALTTLLPLLTPAEADSDGDRHEHRSDYSPDSAPGQAAPLASASRTTRVKVWSLYLTILNAILELEPDEGKDAFGTQEWRALCAKVRDGDIWQDVVRNGYHAREADVDADVVINLATLLLAHSPSQALNQKRLESYLSYAQSPALALAARLGASSPRRSLSRHRSPARGAAAGTDTPRDLNARVKILELYTLHVLLRNDQWDYARDCIAASPLLDEERREAFLQALQSLHDDQALSAQRAREEHEAEQRRRQQELDDARRIRAENEEREQRRIQEERARREEATATATATDSVSVVSAASGATARHHRPPSSVGGSSAKGGRPRSSHGRATASPIAPKAHAIKPQTPKADTVVAPSFGTRTALLFHNVRVLVEQMAAALQSSPLAIGRTLLFIAALLAVLGKRNVRERIARILGTGWHKVKATAGMGVKVSYI